jgi:hypothetical protein
MSRIGAAIAAGCLTAGLVVGPVIAASPPSAPMDMSPPLPWTDSGAKPFVQRDAKNAIVAIGLVIPAATVKATPAKRSEVAMPMTGAGLVQTANLQWHPTGHEPAHVYDLPHFDVHFYTITENVRGGIVPNSPLGKVMPPKAILPPASILAPGYVPGMGMHDILASSPEFNKGKFTVSPIIGYWNGELAFFEVMFTKAWILANEGKTGAYPQPATVHQHGWYPTKYGVHYHKATDSYRIDLTNFRQR